MEVQAHRPPGYEPTSTRPAAAGTPAMGRPRNADPRAGSGRDRHAREPGRELRAPDRPQTSAPFPQGFDDKILALVLHQGRRPADRGAPEEIYGVKVGRDLISRCDRRCDGRRRGLARRPLDDVYPVVFLDCWCSDPRRRIGSAARAVPCARSSMATVTCWAYGSRRTRARSSGCRSSPISTARVQDILIACVDGLDGFPEAIEGSTRRRPSKHA